MMSNHKVLRFLVIELSSFIPSQFLLLTFFSFVSVDEEAILYLLYNNKNIFALHSINETKYFVVIQ